MKQLQREVLFDTKGLYMKEINTLEGNATIKEQQKKIFFDAKGQYMKESNTLEGNVNIKQQQKGDLLWHKSAVHEGVK